jgi:aubergine-like protein
MYYNWTGSIKIPAPVQYAAKLSNLVGDKFAESFKPHTVLGENKSLYFI